MYAVIKSGGKQHRVIKGEHLKIEKIKQQVGDTISFDEILLIGGDGQTKIGQPFVKDASVSAKVVKQDRDAKVRVFKKNRRKGFHKTIGHRHSFTEIEITGIKG